MGALDQSRLNKTEFIRADILSISKKHDTQVGMYPHTLDQPLHFNLSSVHSLTNPLLFPGKKFDKLDLPLNEIHNVQTKDTCEAHCFNQLAKDPHSFITGCELAFLNPHAPSRQERVQRPQGE